MMPLQLQVKFLGIAMNTKLILPIYIPRFPTSSMQRYYYLFIVDELFKIAFLYFQQPRKLTTTNFGDENTDPAAQPLFWVSKWVDYSDKYGFGYQLCDEGMGVMFNDTTKLIMLPNGM